MMFPYYHPMGSAVVVVLGLAASSGVMDVVDGFSSARAAAAHSKTRVSHRDRRRPTPPPRPRSGRTALPPNPTVGTDDRWIARDFQNGAAVKNLEQLRRQQKQSSTSCDDSDNDYEARALAAERMLLQRAKQTAAEFAIMSAPSVRASSTGAMGGDADAADDENIAQLRATLLVTEIAQLRAKQDALLAPGRSAPPSLASASAQRLARIAAAARATTEVATHGKLLDTSRDSSSHDSEAGRVETLGNRPEPDRDSAGANAVSAAIASLAVVAAAALLPLDPESSPLVQQVLATLHIDSFSIFNPLRVLQDSVTLALPSFPPISFEAAAVSLCSAPSFA